MEVSRAWLVATAAAVAGWTWWMGRRFDLAGRVVVITGGSRGLGIVLARQLLAQGARVALLARDARALLRAVEELRRRGGDAVAATCDVRVGEQVDAAIATIARRWGRIDALVNDAGVMQFGPLEHMTVADVEDALATHVLGPLHTTLAVLPHMKRQGEGRIVNIASVGGLVAVPHMLPYCASKFGLVGLSDALRLELHRHGILVTTVCPGLMRTGSPPNALFKGQHEREYAWFAVASALPLATISAERAAAQIVRAMRRGDARLVITAQAKVVAVLDRVAPSLVSRAMTLAGRLLPDPAPDRSTRAHSGHESESDWAPSWLTRLSDLASIKNLELQPTDTVLVPEQPEAREVPPRSQPGPQPPPRRPVPPPYPVERPNAVADAEREEREAPGI